MKSKPKLPEIAADKKQFSNREFLHYLLETRELKLFLELGLKMAKAGKDGTFNTWMLEESDLIQGAARAYGDNLIATRFATVLTECDPELKPMLEKIFTLYALTTIERNLSWFILSNTLTTEQGQKVKDHAGQLCAELGSQALAICDSFAITDTMLSAPIALDWVQYNTYDNQGELISKEEWDRTVMKNKTA